MDERSSRKSGGPQNGFVIKPIDKSLSTEDFDWEPTSRGTPDTETIDSGRHRRHRVTSNTRFGTRGTEVGEERDQIETVTQRFCVYHSIVKETSIPKGKINLLDFGGCFVNSQIFPFLTLGLEVFVKRTSFEPPYPNFSLMD